MKKMTLEKLAQIYEDEYGCGEYDYFDEEHFIKFLNEHLDDINEILKTECEESDII